MNDERLKNLAIVSTKRNATSPLNFDDVDQFSKMKAQKRNTIRLNKCLFFPLYTSSFLFR